jgi:hypothetical protein
MKYVSKQPENVNLCPITYIFERVPDRLWGPPSLLASGYSNLFQNYFYI